MFACCADAMLACVLSACPASAAPPWEGVEGIPADVDLYVHVDGAAELRQRMQALPLAQAFAAAFVDNDLAARWSSIAKRLNRTEVECFDELLGRELRFVVRHGEQGSEWLLATELDDQTLASVREGLGGRMGAGGIIEFPCQGLVAAWRDPVLLVAPSKECSLFRCALEGPYERGAVIASTPVRSEAETAGAPKRRGAASPIGTARRDAEGAARVATPRMLAADSLVTEARQWPLSQLQVFVRHATPFKGSSVFAAEFGARTAVVRHRMRLDGAAPKQDAADAPAVDASLLDRFDSIAFLGSMRRQCDASLLSILDGVVPGVAPCAEMKENAGERWLLLVGAADPQETISCTVPALAVAIEVQEPCKGRRLHEAFIHRAIDRYNERFAARFGAAIEPPRVAACADLEAPRHCDIGQPLRAASGNHPLLRTCSLYWRTVAGDCGNWQVYATHREWLDRVSMRLEDGGPSRGTMMTAGAPTPTADAVPGAGANGASDAVAKAATAPASVRDRDPIGPARRSSTPGPAEGFLRGPAAAAMIESWGAAAEEFAPRDPERFRRGVSLLTSILRGIEWLRWSPPSHARGEVESTIWIELAPPSAP